MNVYLPTPAVALLVGAGLVVMAVIFAVVGIGAMRHRAFLFIMPICWLASPVVPGLMALLWEGRSWHELTDLHRVSWMFVIGDSFFLPLAAACFVYAWSQDGAFVAKFGLKSWWPTLALATGLGAGLWFRYHSWLVYDTERLNSPSKLAHDYFSYPILVTVLLYGGLPALIGRKGRPRHYRNVALVGLIVGIGGWAGVGFLHGEWNGSLDPANLHPLWDWHTFRIIPDA